MRHTVEEDGRGWYILTTCHNAELPLSLPLSLSLLPHPSPLLLLLSQVIATEAINNQPRNGTTTVSIEVANVNDNSPVFENTTYLSIIPENAPPGAFVAMVTLLMFCSVQAKL